MIVARTFIRFGALHWSVGEPTQGFVLNICFDCCELSCDVCNLVIE